MQRLWGAAEGILRILPPSPPGVPHMVEASRDKQHTTLESMWCGFKVSWWSEAQQSS